MAVGLSKRCLLIQRIALKWKKERKKGPNVLGLQAITLSNFQTWIYSVLFLCITPHLFDLFNLNNLFINQWVM